MALSRTAIVEHLARVVGAENVVTDEQELQRSSVDRLHLYEDVHGVYTQPLPAAVAMARSTQHVADVLQLANTHRLNVVARTGRTATEGGLQTIVPDSIVLDGSRMDRVLRIDTYNMQATVQCGVPLQALEDQCRTHGVTTGHSPQSKPIAQMGGLVATRSIGQFSTLYGGIEDMVVGCEAVFADGTVTRIKNVPRRAVGPDIRHVVIGNEGALCYVTEVTVKLFPYLPQNDTFVGWTLKSMRTGFEALRQVMVAGYRPSVARLYDPPDGAFHFSRFAAGDDCVLLFMAEGPAGVVRATIDGIQEIVGRFPDCKPVDARHLAAWFADLNWGPDKIANERREILETRTMGRTTEISADWSSICDIYENALRRLRAEVPDLKVAGGHSSHSYVNGTNMYFIYHYDVKCPPEQEVTRYRREINRVICEETLKLGGSVVHHHGMGKARTPWVREEYGSSYYILEKLKRAFDPNDIMNKGTILPD
ncbi:MAG: FAD-linked oxidoreductase [Steroidobacteraceae bacterium]|nr:FAD-linked oxidoreductase [Steroidobacteraceae bacterium]